MRPDTVEGAAQALQAQGARVLGGGQSLLNVLKLRLAVVDALVDVTRLDELRSFVRSPDRLRLGAAMTYEELATSDDVRATVPSLSEVAESIADPQVRCQGTVGGNVCFNDPASNLPPLLMALDAYIEVASVHGRRQLQTDEFFLEPHRVALQPGELVCAVIVPIPGRSTGVSYRTLQLAEDSWALARAVARVRGDASGRRDWRLVVGCTANAPVRARESERMLEDATPGDELPVIEAVDAALGALAFLDDVHASSEYRRRVTAHLMCEAVTEAAEAANRPEEGR